MVEEESKIIETLIEEFGFTKMHALQVFNELNSEPQIVSDFIKWLDTRNLPILSDDKKETEVEGFTVSDLVERYGMKPINAFITLVWLAQDPKEAKKALGSGYDKFNPIKFIPEELLPKR